jgi:WD40 repeat protein
MSDVFISYSRKDIAFARLLHTALKENGLETWIDWQDIPPSADWLAEVYEAIEQADTFVFMISETSVASEICSLEIAHAAQHNKRLIPIVIGDIDPQKVPTSLAILNWIFFREDEAAFNAGVQDLLTAIQVDQSWVKAHTRNQNRALEWERKDYTGGFLLRGRDLEEAEAWLSQAAEKDPPPTALQTQYILVSRAESNRRQRITFGAVFVGMVVAVVLGILAWTQRNLAIDEGFVRATAQAEAISESNARATEVVIRQAAQVEAETQRDIAISRQLAVNSANQLQIDWDLALLLAIEAGRKADTVEAGIALREARLHPGRTVKLLLDHAGAVGRVSWNPKGQYLLSAGEDGARIWDVERGIVLAKVAENSAPVLWADWDHEGKQIVTTTARGVKVWDVTDVLQGEGDVIEKIFLTGHSGAVVHAAWSPDGAYLVTCSADSTARVWDARSGEDLALFDGHSRQVNHAAWSPDGEYIVSSGGETAWLWNAQTGEDRAALSDNLDAGVFAVWDPEGVRIVTTGLGSAAVWDVASMLTSDVEGLDPIPLRRHTHIVPAMHLGVLRDAAWNPGGSRILTVSANGTVEIWGSEGGRTTSLVGHTDEVHQGMWDPAGKRVVTAGGDGARVWNAGTGQQITLLGGGAILDAAWNPQGTRVATASANGEVRIWSVAAFDEIQSFMASVQERSNWNPDGKIIATSGYDTLVWDVGSGEELVRISGDFAVWDREGRRLLVAMQDGEVNIWDTTAIAQGGDPDPLSTYSGHADEVIYAAWSPDGSSIATTAKDATVRVWNVETSSGQTLTTLDGEPAFYTEWTALGDGLLVVHPQGVFVWGARFEDDKLVLNQRFALEDFTEDVTHATWSPDGGKIISSSREGVQIWDSKSGRLVLELTSENGGANYAAWSPDGKRVLTANLDNAVRIWEASSGQLLAVLAGHNGPVDFAGWDPSSTLVLTASLDSTAGLWDAVSGRVLGVVTGYFGAVRHVAWSPDGLHFAPTSWGGPVRVFVIPPGNTPEEACSLAVRSMTAEEWERFLPDEDCRATCQEVEDLCG